MEAETAKPKAKPRKERIEHAPPEVITRAATAEETPKVAADLAKLAAEHGWEARVTYARGTTDSDTPKLIHSIAVRMRRDAQVAAAVWTSPVELKIVKSKKKIPTGEVELVTVTRKRGGVHSLAPTWTSLVKLGIPKPKGGLALGLGAHLVRAPRKRPPGRVIVSHRAAFLKPHIAMVEVEVESLEQVWGFDFAARKGRWLCQKSGLSGVFPVKLSNTALKDYLKAEIPVANGDLPADIWATGAADLDPEMLEGLTRLASLFAGGDSQGA